MRKLNFCLVSLLTLSSAAAVADDAVVATAPATDVDVAAFEYIDVVETVDGSVFMGVLVEQMPGVKYKVATADGSLHVIQAPDVVKLSKARNKNYRGAVAAMDRDSASVSASADSPRRLPFATSGVRAEIDAAILFPLGRFDGISPTVAPTVHVGYEKLFGAFGVSGGGMGRFIYWNTAGQDGSSGDALWTVEAHAYAQGALHLGRIAPYFGATLGVDLGFAWQAEGGGYWESAPGLGANVTTGIDVAVTRLLTLDLAADYHPDTRAVYNSGANPNYLALRVGAMLRL